MDELSVLDLQNLRHLIGGIRNLSQENDGICFRRFRSSDQTVFPEICPVGHAEQTAAHAVFPLKEVFENDR